LLIAFSQPRML